MKLQPEQNYKTSLSTCRVAIVDARTVAKSVATIHIICWATLFLGSHLWSQHMSCTVSQCICMCTCFTVAKTDAPWPHRRWKCYMNWCSSRRQNRWPNTVSVGGRNHRPSNLWVSPRLILYPGRICTSARTARAKHRKTLSLEQVEEPNPNVGESVSQLLPSATIFKRSFLGQQFDAVGVSKSGIWPSPILKQSESIISFSQYGFRMFHF